MRMTGKSFRNSLLSLTKSSLFTEGERDPHEPGLLLLTVATNHLGMIGGQNDVREGFYILRDDEKALMPDVERK